jgi:hypothetical protein
MGADIRESNFFFFFFLKKEASPLPTLTVSSYMLFTQPLTSGTDANNYHSPNPSRISQPSHQETSPKD